MPFHAVRADGPEVHPTRHNMGRGLHGASANHRDTPRLSRKPGSRANPLRIAGNMSHEWLREKTDHYKEIETGHRAKEDQFKTLKAHPPPDGQSQCQEMRRALPRSLGWDGFMEAWKPSDFVLISRQKVRNRA